MLPRPQPAFSDVQQREPGGLLARAVVSPARDAGAGSRAQQVSVDPSDLAGRQAVAADKPEHLIVRGRRNRWQFTQQRDRFVTMPQR
jgi:hypothetical protein